MNLNTGLMGKNLVQIFLSQSLQSPKSPILSFFNKNHYEDITWEELSRKVRLCAMGLYAEGVRKKDRVALLSENRPEWVIADLAILSLGAIVVPIYPTSSEADVRHIVRNAGVTTLFISTQNQFDRLISVIREEKIRKIISFDDFESGVRDLLCPMAYFYQQGAQYELNGDALFSRLVADVTPDDIATIIYTSGTTGVAKGVMLTHKNFVSNFVGASRLIHVNSGDVALSFLPLSHVFERLAGYYFMLFSGARIAYARSMNTVVEDMGMVRPTVAAAVPRFYEKVFLKVMENRDRLKGGSRYIFDLAIKCGTQVSDYRYARTRTRPFFLKRLFLDLLVLRKIRKAFGGRIRFFISGGAPLSKEIAEFFYAAGVLILEGYGLTETSPVITVNSEKKFRFGTVGQPLDICAVKIAEDGEILTQGPCIMLGYYNNPEETAQVISSSWFHTGDIGELDSDGFLKITDRKKDIIKTSGGKMIAPQNLERRILADPLYSQAVILGDKRNYLVALLVPNISRVQELCHDMLLGDLALEEQLKHPKVIAYFQANIDEKMKTLASFERIKYFSLIPKEFSQDNGELTPTMKIKRRVIQERYRDLIEAMYTNPPASSTGPAANL